MKTLDEVIKALEYCLNPVDNFGNCNAECPYIHCCDPSNHDITEDALHYLKECQDMIKKLENCQKENQRLKKELRNWKVMLLGMLIIDVGRYRGCGNEDFR